MARHFGSLGRTKIEEEACVCVLRGRPGQVAYSIMYILKRENNVSTKSTTAPARVKVGE